MENSNLIWTFSLIVIISFGVILALLIIARERIKRRMEEHYQNLFGLYRHVWNRIPFPISDRRHKYSVEELKDYPLLKPTKDMEQPIMTAKLADILRRHPEAKEALQELFPGAFPNSAVRFDGPFVVKEDPRDDLFMAPRAYFDHNGILSNQRHNEGRIIMANPNYTIEVMRFKHSDGGTIDGFVLWRKSGPSNEDK